MPEPLQPWAKEPWFAKEHPDGSGGLIYVPHESGAIVLLAETLEGKDLARANRIIACINACAGVPTEALEAWCNTIEIVRLHMADDIDGYIVKLRVTGECDIEPHKEPTDE